jgi:peptide-methionine (R)-S-oxide reductase
VTRGAKPAKIRDPDGTTMTRSPWFPTFAAALIAVGLVASSSTTATVSSPAARTAKKGAAPKRAAIEKIVKTDADWKRSLTPEQYRVLRQKGTEPAFTGRYWNNHARGVYVCAACGLELFDSSTKFDSGTGWPSFWTPIAKDHVEERSDSSLGMVRTEVECARCGGHLGHLFDDGPKPTGLRYCINSASLAFDPQKK